MMPGDVKRVAFTFDVEPALADPEAKVQLQIRDEDLREEVDEKVRLPLMDALAVTLLGRKPGREGDRRGPTQRAGTPSGRVSSRRSMPAGMAATVQGTVNGYVKLSLGDGRYAFAKTSDLEPAHGPASSPLALEDAMAHAPPALEIPQPQLATRDTHTLVHGSGSDDAQLLDAYIFRRLEERSSTGPIATGRT